MLDYAPGYEAIILCNVGTLLDMSISYTVFVNKKGINSAFIKRDRFVFTLFTVVRKYTGQLTCVIFTEKGILIGLTELTCMDLAGTWRQRWQTLDLTFESLPYFSSELEES